MSIPRLLGIIALILFIVFVATFFTVLVRLSRIGVTTERYVEISAPEVAEPEAVFTRLDLLGQDHDTGRLRFDVTARIDTRVAPFNTLTNGDTVIMRVENLLLTQRRNMDLAVEFRNPTRDAFVNLKFGTFQMDIQDLRDFYPFDGYECSYNFAYHLPGNWSNPAGMWYQPKEVTMRCLTNLIFLNPRYGTAITGERAFKVRIARLRILQFLAVSLILIELLFLLYLLTLVNLQELLAKGLGYLVGLYIIRNILVTEAPQFPNLIDYGTLFLICVVFFLMLFKSLGGAEERALITLPAAWREALTGQEEHVEEIPESTEDE
jgi:hypothetical protein